MNQKIQGLKSEVNEELQQQEQHYQLFKDAQSGNDDEQEEAVSD